MGVNVVLVEPEIPQNTGNIARTCAAVGANLHLVKPLGFSVNDRYLKRAGLDYWDKLDIKYYDSFKEVKDAYPHASFYYASTKAAKTYADVKYPNQCFLVFGKETAGLPEKLLKENYENSIRIPMRGNIRSLNLSNSVAVVVYEVLRQHEFTDLELHGRLKMDSGV